MGDIKSKIDFIPTYDRVNDDDACMITVHV